MILMGGSKQCVFCLEEIPVEARKCKHCLEIQDQNYSKGDRSTFEGLIHLIGKSFIPLVILIIVFSFKPSFEKLMEKANEVEVLGAKLVFFPGSKDSVELSAYEIYYLIHSVSMESTKTVFKYSLFKKEKSRMESIKSLEKKGLITFDVKDDGFFEGDQSIFIGPTGKGKAFLKKLKIKF